MSTLKSIFNFLAGKKPQSDNQAPSPAKPDIDQNISDWLNRPIYKELTVEIIDKVPDDDLLQTIFDNLIEKFPKDHQKQYDAVMSFSEGQRAFFMIWNLDVEVKNGGSINTIITRADNMPI